MCALKLPELTAARILVIAMVIGAAGAALMISCSRKSNAGEVEHVPHFSIQHTLAFYARPAEYAVAVTTYPPARDAFIARFQRMYVGSLVIRLTPVSIGNSNYDIGVTYIEAR